MAGAAINHDNRGKGALIGAAVAGAAGAGYGYYVDKQEEELRRSMQGTGVEVQRQGDTIQLIDRVDQALFYGRMPQGMRQSLATAIVATR